MCSRNDFNQFVSEDDAGPTPAGDCVCCGDLCACGARGCCGGGEPCRCDGRMTHKQSAHRVCNDDIRKAGMERPHPGQSQTAPLPRSLGVAGCIRGLLAHACTPYTRRSDTLQLVPSRDYRTIHFSPPETAKLIYIPSTIDDRPRPPVRTQSGLSPDSVRTQSGLSPDSVQISSFPIKITIF